VIAKEPPKTKEKRVTERMNVPLPAFVAGYYMPEDGHPDSYPLKVASRILSAGQSSRLYRKLVYDMKIALAAQGVGNFTEDPNLFFAFAVMNPGHTTEEGEKAVYEELEKLKNEPVPAQELEKAKNQMVSEILFERHSNEGKAESLGRAAVILKDPTLANKEVERILAVRADDIMRVAKKYFLDANRIVLTILPQQEGASKSE